VLVLLYPTPVSELYIETTFNLFIYFIDRETVVGLAYTLSISTKRVKGKGLDTCYSATYMSGLVTSSALQSQ